MSHIIEVAKSGRSKCRTCREKIEKNTLRFGEEVINTPEPYFRYHHLKCVSETNPVELSNTLENTKEDIPDKETLLALINESKKKLIYGFLTDYNFKNFADTHYDRCHYCGERILENLIIVEERGSFADERGEKTYLHVSCAKHAIDDDHIVETIRKNSHKLSKTKLNDIIDILKNNDKEDPMSNPDYIQKSWPLIKEYINLVGSSSDHPYMFFLDDTGRASQHTIGYRHPQELYNEPIGIKGDILKDKRDFEHVIPIALVKKKVLYRYDYNADYWVFLDWRENSDKPRVLLIGTESRGYEEMVFDSIEQLCNTNLYSKDYDGTEEPENIKKSRAFTEKWMGKGIARSGNYFFFLQPDELYDMAMEGYSDYLEDNWDFDNVIPVACVEEDFDNPGEQDLGHADYWVFLDWRENSTKPCVIVTGSDSWEYDDMIFDSIENLLDTPLY